MQSLNGRQFADRTDLMAHSGYGESSLRARWSDRENNGHPPARTIDGVMHWDLVVWSEWFRGMTEQRPRDLRRIDRTGDPDEELPPVKQARVLGVDTSKITAYRKNPPPGWPAPVRVEKLPTRDREYRTRRQLWEFADGEGSRVGTVGGRPTGPDPKVQAAKQTQPDPRVAAALDALAVQPDRMAGDLALALAEQHGGSLPVWRRAVTAARKQTR
ncbi:hypothetical protein [Streptomyces sp. CB00316]|uniref:hypothetical protein n=1 Tax=Streptomyces sp. CB00316 TaxID=1703932 RepID=UPI00093B8519|nr:hypothetical protein [Streptomyces sp. CB00316]